MFTKVIVFLTTILTLITQSEEQVLTWCDAYETFCLFSYGSQLKVSNLTEAQEVCSKANNKSWPIEITSQHVEDVLKQFLNNVSLPSNVHIILNAVLQNNEWYWIENNSSFSVSNYFVDDSIVSYRYGTETTSTNLKYALICTVECKAEWKHFENSGVDGLQSRWFLQSYDDCKYACETSRSYKCTGFDFNPFKNNEGCWIFNDPNIAKKAPQYKPGVSHDVINRTSKSVDQCIGHLKDITDFKNSTDINLYQNMTTATKIILGILIPMLLLIIVVSIVVGVLLCRRKVQRSNAARKQTLANIENKNDIISKFPRSNSLKYIDLNFEEEQQKQQDTNINSENIGETNMSFVLTGEPKRYNGPGGEAYTEVDRTFGNVMTIY